MKPMVLALKFNSTILAALSHNQNLMTVQKQEVIIHETFRLCGWRDFQGLAMKIVP